MEFMSDEILLHIFGFLSGKEVCTCSLVSKTWHIVTNEPTLWCKVVVGVPYPPIKTSRVLLGKAKKTIRCSIVPTNSAAVWFGNATKSNRGTSGEPDDEDIDDKKHPNGFIHPSVMAKIDKWLELPPLEKSLKWLYRAKVNPIDPLQSVSSSDDAELNDSYVREFRERLHVLKHAREREAAARRKTQMAGRMGLSVPQPAASNGGKRTKRRRDRSKCSKLMLSTSPPPPSFCVRQMAASAESTTCDGGVGSRMVGHPRDGKEARDNPTAAADSSSPPEKPLRKRYKDRFDVGFHQFSEYRWYVGDWLDGKTPHGTGILYDDGLLYIGELFYGKYAGVGRIMWPGGATYKGSWRNGFHHGIGRKTWVTGGVYDGEFKFNREDGLGRHTWSDGGFYEGRWRSSCQHGRGMYVWPSGNRFVGEWSSANQQSGVYAWIDGRRYEGEYSKGNKHGKGRYDFHDSSFYSGDWQDGVRHGWGYMVWADGCTYSGMWDNDIPVEGEANFPMDQIEGMPFYNYFGEDMNNWELKYIHKIRQRIQKHLAEIPRENLFRSMWEHGYVPPCASEEKDYALVESLFECEDIR